MGLGGRWVSEGQNGGAAQLRTALENHGPRNDKAPAFRPGLRIKRSDKGLASRHHHVDLPAFATDNYTSLLAR